MQLLGGPVGSNGSNCHESYPVRPTNLCVSGPIFTHDWDTGKWDRNARLLFEKSPWNNQC